MRTPRARFGIVRETAVALLISLATIQVVIDNSRVTHVDYAIEPRWMLAPLIYLQFLQTWALYAPDARTMDTNVYVDAVTAAGRHVDPFNEIASPNHPHPGPHIPPRLGQTVLFSNYVLRIPYYEAYHQAFQEWILRYPERTGNPNDRIVSFEAVQVNDESPLPGQRDSRNTSTYRFIKYPQ